MARALREFADEVEHAKHQVEQLAIEVGASIAIGTAAAFFTFGATEVAADGIAGALVSNAARVGVGLSARAAAIAGRIGAEAAFGAVTPDAKSSDSDTSSSASNSASSVTARAACAALALWDARVVRVRLRGAAAAAPSTSSSAFAPLALRLRRVMPPAFFWGTTCAGM